MHFGRTQDENYGLLRAGTKWNERRHIS